MKQWMIGFMLVLANLSFADQVVYKKSLGKPRVNAVFMDSDIIRLLPNQSQTIDIKIQYTAEAISYLVFATDGLTLDENQPSIEVIDKAQNGVLSIPVQISVNKEGRFYIHIQITTQQDGVETKGVISKVVSSEIIKTVEAMKKASQSNQIHILPATETIKKKTDE